MENEILFEYSYNGDSFILKNKGEDLDILLEIANLCVKKATFYLEIDKKPIDDLIKKHIKIKNENLKEKTQLIAEQLSKIKQNEFDFAINESVKNFDPIKSKAITDPDKLSKISIKDVAQDYFCQKLFETCNINFFLNKNFLKNTKESNRIGLRIKYDDWIVIKKKKITKDTLSWEISGILTSILNSVYEKYFNLKINNFQEILEDGINNCAKKRRTLKGLSQALLNFSNSQYEEKLDIAVLYSYVKATSFMPFINIHSMTRAYPDLKIKKPKGKMPGMKNKK